MVKFYFAPAIVEEATAFLDIGGDDEREKQAHTLRELTQRVKRIYKLYTAQPSKRGALYWDKLDTLALYSITSNEQFTRRQADRALSDLERVEAFCDKMPQVRVDVYNDLALYVEMMARRMTSNEFNVSIADFVAPYSPQALEFLRKLVSFAFERLAREADEKKAQDTRISDMHRFLVKSVQDLVRRIKASIRNPQLRNVFMARLEYSLGVLDKAIEIVRSRTTATAPPATPLKTEQKAEPVLETAAQPAAEAAPAAAQTLPQTSPDHKTDAGTPLAP
jgi:hypothetical protein